MSERANDADSATAIAADVTEGRRTAQDVLGAHVARHRASRSRLNALVQPRHDEAAREAAAGPRGPLAGVPVSVKDCFAVQGLRTTLGIAGFGAAPDATDAEIVARLREAGAIVVGKANVPEAMYLHETANTVWGRTTHPAAADRSPGGSSGGDAALVAAGVVPLAVGNDLAGSLRQPAHACGIATLMPRSSVLGEGGAFDTVPHLRAMRPRAGFLARHVADLDLATAAVAPLPAVAEPIRRVGWWDTTGPLPASAAIRRGVAEAVARLEAAGIEAVPLDGRLAEDAAWIHLGFVSADGGSDIQRLFAGGGQVGTLPEDEAGFGGLEVCPTGPGGPMPAVRQLLALGGMPRWLRLPVALGAWLSGRRVEARGLLATGPRTEAGLAPLLAARASLARQFAAATAGCDAVVCPVSALPALRYGTAARLLLAAAPCMLANLLDLAAGVVPVTHVRPDEELGRPRSWDPVLRAAAETDRGSRGLPVGVQVLAPPGRGERSVLAVMRLIEAA
jgi:fatty acid amide hydrolase